jgi:preprotein translocase subunit Sec63
MVQEIVETIVRANLPFIRSECLTQMSYYSHPDKVKIVGNMTAESVAAKFVEITKAYKS